MKQAKKKKISSIDLNDPYIINLLNHYHNQPGSLYWKDIEGFYVWNNQEFLSETNCQEPIIGKKDEELWPQDYLQVIENDKKVLANRKTYYFEEILHVNAKKEYFIVIKTPLKNAKNKVIGISANLIALNKVEKYQTFSAKEVKPFEQKSKILDYDLRNIIEFVPGCIYWKNKDGVWAGCNNYTLKTTGIALEDLIGKTDYELWPEHAKELRENDLKVMNTGCTLRKEESVVLPNREKKYFAAEKMPWRDTEGNIIGIIGNSIEITEHKNLETDLKKLIQAMKLMGTSMAHELRTPVRSINSCAQAIEQSLLPLSQQLKHEPRNLSQLDTVLELFKIIELETKAAFNIIDMLLIKANLTQIDTSKFKIFSVAQCVAEAVDRYFIEDGEKKLIDLYILEKDFLCKGDYVLFTHVLFNLLKNALYYVHAANKGRIEIRLQSSDTYNQLIFRDSGSGIAPDVLPYIFGNFFSRTANGTGIGLAFCKLVLTSFGGDIICDSVYGEFTEFILTFPHV